MHVTSGRWVYGLFLALVTAVLWGILPIKLKEVLEAMDPVTVTWYRLFVSGTALLIYLGARQQLPRWAPLGRKGFWLLLIMVAGLSGNYVLYLVGLDLLTPGTTQLVIQMGPVLMLFGSLIVFKERFSRAQAVGLAILLSGFALFFNERLIELFTSLDRYTTGILITLLAAFAWAFYGLGQKQMLMKWRSVQIMMVVYLGCAAVLTPWAHPLQLFQLSSVQFWLLVACCLNTLVAYGAFAEALAHWEASKVSSTLAITPLLTLVAAECAAWYWPGRVAVDSLNALAIVGALLVVAGSAFTAAGMKLFQRRKLDASPTASSELLDSVRTPEPKH